MATLADLVEEVNRHFNAGLGVPYNIVKLLYDELDSARIATPTAQWLAVKALCAELLKQPCVPVFKKVSVREQLLECLRVQFPSVEFRLKLLNIYVGEVRAHSRIGGSRGRVALLRVVLLEAG